MRKIIPFVLWALSPILASDVTLNPSTFTANNLSGITDETTVYLEAGTYTVNQTIINAWVAGSKKNVTFKPGGSGAVIMNGTQQDETKLITVGFDGWKGLLLENIHFKNLSVSFLNCTKSTMNGLLFTDQKFSGTLDKKSKNYNAIIDYGSHCTIENCTIIGAGEDDGDDMMGIKVRAGKYHQLINNTIRGTLKRAIKILGETQNGNSIDPVANHVIHGGVFNRESGRDDFQDHGIYIHNISHITVRNVEVWGWTDDGAGQSIKIKSANYINAYNNEFHRSGIIIRVAENCYDANDHIWIHHNIFYEGKINSWTDKDDGFTINNSCVIENNQLNNGTISGTTEDVASFNSFNNLAGKDGGVFNNCVNSSIVVKPGINNSGNTIGGTIPGAGIGASPVAVTGISVSPTSLSLTKGQIAYIIEVFSPFDATDRSINWSSGDTSVATVNDNGSVKAVYPGNATITVTTNDGGFSARCDVTVTGSTNIKPESFSTQTISHIKKPQVFHHCFSSFITFTYYCPQPNSVILSIFNTTGQEIYSNNTLPNFQGYNTVQIKELHNQYSGGQFIYKLNIGNKSASDKFVITK